MTVPGWLVFGLVTAAGVSGRIDWVSGATVVPSLVVYPPLGLSGNDG